MKIILEKINIKGMPSQQFINASKKKIKKGEKKKKSIHPYVRTYLHILIIHNPHKHLP